MMQQEIPKKEWLVTDEQVFSGFDLEDPGMEAVNRALEKTMRREQSRRWLITFTGEPHHIFCSTTGGCR